MHFMLFYSVEVITLSNKKSLANAAFVRECPRHVNIVCPVTDFGRHCARCGWDPVEESRRRARLREKYAVGGAIDGSV